MNEPIPLPHEIAIPIDAVTKLIAQNAAGDEIDFRAYFASRYRDAHQNPVGSTDSRRALYSELAARESQLLDYQARMKSYLASVQAAMSALIDDTTDCLHVHPQVDFRDSLGVKLRLQLNASAKLEIAETFVPPEYYCEKVTQIIDKERIKEELTSGTDLPFAQLIRGVHLKGLK